MKTKKFLAGAVASLMLAAAMPTVMAADGFEVAISNTTAKAGEEFTLTVDMTNIPDAGVNGCDFGIQYDSSVLTISDVALGDLAKGDLTEVEGMPDPFSWNIDNDLICLAYGIGTTNIDYNMTGSGTFLTITGTVSGTAAAGTKSPLKIVAIDRNASSDDDGVFLGNYDAEGNATLYTPTLTDGYVEILSDGTEESSETTIEFGTPSKYGDVNVDGIISSTDVVLLNKYLLSPNSYPLAGPVNYANADAFTDGKLNLNDSTVITNVVLEVMSENELGPQEIEN